MTVEDLDLLAQSLPLWWRPFKRRRWDRAARRRDYSAASRQLAALYRAVYPPETVERAAFRYHPSTWSIHEETKPMTEQPKSGVFQAMVRDQNGDPIFIEHLGRGVYPGSVFLCETAWDEEIDDPRWVGRQFTPDQAREVAAALLASAALADEAGGAS